MFDEHQLSNEVDFDILYSKFLDLVAKNNINQETIMYCCYKIINFIAKFSDNRIAKISKIYGVLNKLPNNSGLLQYKKKCNSLLNSFIFKNDKRIAICISGMLRGEYGKLLDDIYNKIAKKINADCFLFTWRKGTPRWPGLTSGASWSGRFFPKTISRACPKEIKNKEDLQNVLPLVFEKLKQPIYEDVDISQINNDSLKLYEVEDENYRCCGYSNVAKMWYGIYRSYKLMEKYENANNIKYDIIIRIRPDVIIGKNELDENFLQSIGDCIYLHRNVKSGLPSDFFAIGGRKSMNIYMSLWENIDNFDLIAEKKTMSSPHKTLHLYLVANNINTSSSPLEVLHEDKGELIYKNLFFPNIFHELEQDLSKEFFNTSRKNFIKNFFYKLQQYNHVQNSACRRVENHLAYRLGDVIVNQKGLKILKLPYLLLKELKKFQFFQKESQNILKDFNLKMQSLNKCSDYEKSIKITNYFFYKLGQLLIKANKEWYKGGYIKFWYNLYQLKKEFKDKKG
ncbi:hypothetical protein IO383_001434 [Campylobacter lari]|nr:hypothetical protein [Campylobacter lari]